MARKGHYTLKFADGRQESLALSGKALNRGADGAIYRSPDGRYALKYYHEPGKDPARQHKVWQMILHPPEDTQANHFAWPCALLFNPRGVFVGFAMPLLDITSYASLDMALSARGRQIESLPQSSAWRLQVAINLCKRVAELHEKGHCIIDLKPANLLVHRRSGDVAVVDCDGFAVQGNDEYFPAHQFTMGFIAPEAFSSRQSPQVLRQPQDQFALAVILFKLLNNGLHPYQGVPTRRREIPTDNQNRIGGGFYPYGIQAHADIKPSPWSVHQDFPAIVRQTFDHSFTARQRPSAREWVELLEQAAQRLKQCSQIPEHGYWGKQCPHCARANTRVRVNKPKPTQRPRAPLPQGQAPLYIPVPAPAAPPPSIGFGTIFSIVIALFVGILLLSSGDNSSSRSYSPPGTTQPAPSREPVVLQPPTYFDQGPALASDMATEGSGLYRERPNPMALNFREDIVRDAVPFYRLGPFTTPQALPLILSAPLNNQFASLAPDGVKLAHLDATNGTLSIINDHSQDEQIYGLEYWQPDQNQGVFVPRCNARMACSALHHLQPGKQPVAYALPKIDDEGSGGHWRFAVSPDGRFLALANRQQVVTYALGRPNSPLATARIPEHLRGHAIEALSLNSGASRIFLSMARSENYGVNFDALLLELTRDGNQLSMDESFAEQARLAGTQVLGAYHAIDAEGSTLAVAEYQEHEINSTDYRWLNQPVTAAVAYPAISIWQRDELGQWRFSYRIEWRELRGSRKLQLSGPRRMTLFNGFQLNNRKVSGDSQPHHDFQLSADGNLLLSGLETEERNNRMTASAYLFDIRSDNPGFIGRLTSRVHGERNWVKVAYPDVRLSRNADYAAIGWFLYEEQLRGKELSQSYQIEIFRLPKGRTTPALARQARQE